VRSARARPSPDERRAWSRLRRPAILSGLMVNALLGFGPGLFGQDAPDPSSPYLDSVARSLHGAAMDNRIRRDASVVAYTAVVQQRVGVALRMPLKDRTLYRSEAAHRIWWNRDAEDLIQVLAFREQTPAGINRDDVDVERFDVAFDPMDDRLLFGFASSEDDLADPDEDDFRFEHPLYREYVDAYRFSSGDTITLSLPDGRSVMAVELRMVPTQADVHRVTGSLWIEPESGALVRAVYRLSDTFDAFRDVPDLREEEDDDLRFVPGILKPWTAEISMISVDYGLWDFEVWMPRGMRMDGVVAAGILKAPLTVDFSYELESVTTERSLRHDRLSRNDLPEVHFETRSEAMAYLNELAFGGPVETEVDGASVPGEVRYVLPRDRTVLYESDQLPPPVWEDGTGFASRDELEERFATLTALPRAPLSQTPYSFRWGLQRPDLVRFNRIEGLSVGGRLQLRPNTPIGPLSATVTGRLGYADLEPNGRVDVTRETLERRITVSAFHELAAIDEDARHLELGNSLMGLFFGRDDGDYYRRTGGSVTWTPASARRRTFRVVGYAEYQEPTFRETDFAVFRSWKDDFDFRPNLAAEEGWDVGGLVVLSPWWGTDPRLAQGGLEVRLRGGTGLTDYGRGSVVGRGVLPLGSDYRAAVEVGAGASVGTPSSQRLWYVGGPRSLRGYDPRIMGGESFGRARGEVGRLFAIGTVSAFFDYAWAGDASTFSLGDGFYSVGGGLSLVDGLLRLDVGYGLRDPRDVRIDFYLDAIL